MSDPYLRTIRSPRGPRPLTPPDHTTARVGEWNGRPTEVVFDPNRHDVVCIRGHLSADVIRGLDATGWDLRLTDGVNELWVRDRAALVRARLDRAANVVPLRRTAPSPPRIA